MPERQPKLALYYSPGACSLGPHILCEELGLDVEFRRVVVLEGEHRKPEYLTVNPRARVPALEIDGRVATEGPAIMTFLANLKPDSGLLPPAGTWEQARVLEWLNWFSSVFHIGYAHIWRTERYLPGGHDPAAMIAFGREQVLAQGDEIEAALVGPWLLGERFSAVDCYLLAFYRWGVRIGLPMTDRYPAWTAWKDRMLGRPAVLRAIESEGIGTAWAPL